MTDQIWKPTIIAARDARVTIRQLNHWTVAGYVHPTTATGQGHGGRRLRWSVGDIDRAELLGVFSRTLVHRELLSALAKAAEDGTNLVQHDGDYTVAVTWGTPGT
jgi:hypothetical protein